MTVQRKTNKQFLLVEPLAKTPYPPLGLMKISTMLKRRYPGCRVVDQVGNAAPVGITRPESVYITSLFTWDIDKVLGSINYYRRQFPKATIKVGGIAASLLPEHIRMKSGIRPHVGILKSAEACPPDYTAAFGRKVTSSISFTSRGCIRNCKFCTVRTLEPEFFTKSHWEKDISPDLPAITFWDNNWLASPNFEPDAKKLTELRKRVDFNQGLDARLFDKDKAQLLSGINLDPIRFAFDHVAYENRVLRAIRLAKKYLPHNEIRVYVLYNFKDTPEDFYHRIDLLNKYGVLAFPMEYREPTEMKMKFPGRHWDKMLLRGLKLSLLFYYRRGMITKSRNSFRTFYGTNASAFKRKLYEIYRYDKNLSRGEKGEITDV